MSEKLERDISIDEAVRDYVDWVLPDKPDERSVVGVDTQSIPVRARD